MIVFVNISPTLRIFCIIENELFDRELPPRSAVLIDLSGTLHVEDIVIPGCVAALERLLQDRAIGVRFVTNTTKKSRQDLTEELHRIGLTSIEPESVLTSGGIARALLEKRGLRPLLLVDPSLESEFVGLERADPNAVVVGLAPQHFHYDKLNETFRILLSGGSLIALHEARYFAVKDGLNIGPGAFVKALEYAANTKAAIIGKPSPSFFQQALDELDVKAHEAVMIGDDVRQDVGSALAIGMRGVVVRLANIVLEMKPQQASRLHLSCPTSQALLNGFSVSMGQAEDGGGRFSIR